MLLTIAALVDEAFGVGNCDELEKRTGRAVKLGVAHAVWNRLEEKVFIKSKLGEATNVLCGKSTVFLYNAYSSSSAMQIP